MYSLVVHFAALVVHFAVIVVYFAVIVVYFAVIVVYFAATVVRIAAVSPCRAGSATQELRQRPQVIRRFLSSWPWSVLPPLTRSQQGSGENLLEPLSPQDATFGSILGRDPESGTNNSATGERAL